jgi:hypothetical protein
LHELLQVVEESIVATCDKSGSHTLATRSTSSTDSVSVINYVCRGMEIDDMTHTLYIKTSRCNIGAYKDVINSIL